MAQNTDRNQRTTREKDTLLSVLPIVNTMVAGFLKHALLLAVFYLVVAGTKPASMIMLMGKRMLAEQQSDAMFVNFFWSVEN